MEIMWPAGLTVLGLAVAALVAVPMGLRWAWQRWRAQGRRRTGPARAGAFAPQRPPAKVPGPQRTASLQRLHQRLLQEKLDLQAQLRAAQAALERILHDHADVGAALQQQMAQQIETLHQDHEVNLRHMLTVYLDQIDHLHRLHANHGQALAAELERQKSLPARDTGGTNSSGWDTSEADTSFGNTVISDTAYATTRLSDTSFAPTTALAPKWPA
jgi:hypothetical protein